LRRGAQYNRGAASEDGFDIVFALAVDAGEVLRQRPHLLVGEWPAAQVLAGTPSALAALADSVTLCGSCHNSLHAKRFHEQRQGCP
jgi:hypothetical protein